MAPVGNSRVTQMNKMTAQGALQQYIVSTRRYKLVDRSRIDQIMKSHTFDRGGMVDTSKVKEIGKMLQADIVCVTEMRKEDGNFIAVCSLIDVESGEVSASAYELIESDTAPNIRDAMNRAAMTMLGKMDGSPPPAASASSPVQPPKPAGDPLQDPRQARIAVVIPEIHITRQIPDPAGETAIIRKFLEAGFTRMVDKNQVDKIRNSDAVKALLRGDVAAAASIGQQLGVDYIIVGEAFSEAVGFVGSGLFSCRARVEARAIRTDNARILATNGFHAGGVDLTESTSAKVALNNAGEMMGDYMVKQLLSGIGGGSASGIKLTATGVKSFSNVSELERALKSIKGVDSVRINEFNGGVATIDISTSLSAQALAASIGALKAPRLEVVETSDSAMKIRMR
jgi:TolB-like protein